MSRGDTSILEHYLQPLRAHLDAPGVTELVINRPGEFAVERAGAWTWFEAPELTEAWLAPLAVAAAAASAQDVSPDQPICSTTLPTGERCQVVMPPAAEHLSLTFRKPSTASLSLEDLVAEGLFRGAGAGSAEARPDSRSLEQLYGGADWPAFLAACVRSRRNILISGATGSGKTTLAKALVGLIPLEERIVTIEDTRELTVPHRNAVHLLYAKDGQGLARADAGQLVEAALRMRPDRILLQELRDGSAFTFLRSIAGHPGIVTTLHAASPALAFEQLVLMVKQSSAGRELQRDDILALLHALIDVVVQIGRTGGRFRVDQVWRSGASPSSLSADKGRVRAFSSAPRSGHRRRSGGSEAQSHRDRPPPLGR